MLNIQTAPKIKPKANTITDMVEKLENLGLGGVGVGVGLGVAGVGGGIGDLDPL